MKHRERRIDEVFFLRLLAVNDEAFEQVQEFQLAAGQVVVLTDELVKGFADRFREAFQDLKVKQSFCFRPGAPGSMLKKGDWLTL